MKKQMVLIALLLATAPCFAQGIVAYEDANYQGKSITITKDMAWIGNEWNDKISSFRIPAGYTIQIFEDANYGGMTRTIKGDWTVTNSTLQWNDRVSSIKILSAPEPAPPGITIYEHANFQGKSKLVTSDVAFVGNDWNDQISSIRVPSGYTIQVYGDADFKGPVMKMFNNWTVTPQDMEWNDKISSIRIIASPRRR